MPETMLFADVVDAADALSDDEQEELIAILRKRAAERGREQMIRECLEAEAEFAAGNYRVGDGG